MSKQKMDIFNPQNKKNRQEFSGGSLEKQPNISGDETEQKVPISNSSNAGNEVNGSEEEDSLRNSFFKKRKKIIIGAGSFFAILLLFAGGWAFCFYEKYFKSVSIEDVLSGNSDVVLKLNINPDSSQYKLLDAHFEKFPGYDRVMKEFDDVGEGITISQFINKKLNERGLDFNQDIKPALSDNAYLLILSLDPIENRLQQKVSLLKDLSGKALKSHFALSGEEVLTGENEEIRVLGTTDDYYLMAGNEEADFSPVDYVFSSHVEDLKKAKEVLEKIQKDIEKYQVTKFSFQGYDYYKVVNKGCETTEHSIIDLRDSFYAVVGSNLVVSSTEDEIKRTIARTRSGSLSGRILDKLPLKKESISFEKPLSQDDQYKKSTENVEAGISLENQLAGVFYRFNPKKMFNLGEEQGETLFDYFNYPEQIAGSFSFVATDSGLKLKMSSNQYSLEQKNNISFMEGLVQKIPNRLDGRWGDIYLEYDSPKSVYYGFKRNNLSQKGLDAWNEAREMIRQGVGVDLEKDLIDNVSGDVALAVYTGRGLEPEEALVVGVENQEKVISTMNKLLELGKQMYVGMNPYAQCFGGNLAQNKGGSDVQAFEGSSFCASLEKEPAKKKVIEQQLQEVLASSLRETKTQAGSIYSYNLPGTKFSFDFGFKDGQAIFGSHYAIVDAMTKEFGTNPENVISSNKYYKQVAENVFPKGYTKACVNSFGLWNSVEYYLRQFMEMQSGETMAEMGKVDGSRTADNLYADNLYAIGSIVRTVKLVGASDAVSEGNGNVMSSLYLNIEELPAEEKQKAEAIIQLW